MAAFKNVLLVLPAKQINGYQIRSISNKAFLLQNVSTPAATEEPKRMSMAMKSYMERAKAHDLFISQQLHKYNVGKRHLANMMGRDPAFFTQEDVDEAIQYLFPSGLFNLHARPVMKHPDEIFHKRKEAEFDFSGRPFHFLFYTGKPNYYSLLHDVNSNLAKLNAYEDQSMGYSLNPYKSAFKAEKINLAGSDWLQHKKLEQVLLEKISDKEYQVFLKALNRFVEHPHANLMKDFVMKYRFALPQQSLINEIPQLLRDESGRLYMTSSGKRKKAFAQVKVIGQGTGLIEINGQGIEYFDSRQDREQILFPLQFTELLGIVDVIATTEGGGHCGQAGAIRHGISLCLRSFVTDKMVEEMRLAGLLSYDPRVTERKKYGQRGARKKYTWKRR